MLLLVGAGSGGVA